VLFRSDVLVRARRVARGNSVRVTVKRGSDTVQLTIKPAEGI